MNNFTLYEKLLSQSSLNDDECKENDNECEDSDDECYHDNIITEKNITLCTDCGIEIHSKLDSTINKHNTDPNRCHIRKTKDRNIYDDVKNMGFCQRIVDIANDIFLAACGGTTHRGSYRKGIIFASIFHSYKIDMNPQQWESLIKIVKVSRKRALSGMKFINLFSPKVSPIRNSYITPVHLINDFMKKFNATQDQKDEVVALYKQIKGRSSMINRSRPQSVAAGVIYYYILKGDRGISLKEFTKKVGLSELTVNKFAKESARIIDKKRRRRRRKRSDNKN
jgi:hypothetical protein